jgi:predicted secreted protein
MRGSPLAQAVLVVAALLLLLIPLHHLTQREQGPPERPTVSSAPKQVHLAVRTTAVPCRFQIMFLGKTLWAEDATTPELTKDFDIDFPKEGIDLVVDATWETKALAAIEITLSLPDGTAIPKTLWGQGTANEVLTFKEE